MNGYAAYAGMVMVPSHRDMEYTAFQFKVQFQFTENMSTCQFQSGKMSKCQFQLRKTSKCKKMLKKYMLCQK